MAHPVYWRAPFGIMKRLRPSQVAHTRIQPHLQWAGYAVRADAQSGMTGAPIATDATETASPESPYARAKIEPESLTLSGRETKAREELMKGMGMEAQFAPEHTHLHDLDPATREVIYNTHIPRSVQAIYLRPLRRAPTYGVSVCDLQMRSYSIRNLEFFADFAMRVAYYLGLAARGPIPLPRITERWTVPRSNFIHKKSQENFERKTLRRLIQIQDGHPEVVQCWLGYLEKRAYYGIGMKANVWEFEGLGVGKRLDERAAIANEQMKEQWDNFGVRANAATTEKLGKLLGSKAFSSQVKPAEGYRREPIEIKRD